LDPRQARQQIERHRDLNAFISLTEEEGDAGATVVAVKDLVDVRGTVTTAGGIILPPRPAAGDAAVVAQMRRHGCLVVGKASLHEWAFGVTSENPHYGPVRNPRDPDRVAGGSSGGSAVAVACGMCDWAVGSDTGGSIRVPASFCGVVGFKPTLGSVEMAGVFPLSRTLDTLGPLAPDVRGAARALEQMTGRRLPLRERRLAELRLAMPRGWVHDLDEPTQAAWEKAAKDLPEVDFPERVPIADDGGRILFGEAGALHRRWFAEQPEKYGEDVAFNLQRALELKAADYVLALEALPGHRAAVEAALAGVDAILLPTTARIAPRIGQAPASDSKVREPITRYTRPFNTTGHPAISLPAPVDGLPVGIQVVGHFGRDAELAEVALALEAAWAG